METTLLYQSKILMNHCLFMVKRDPQKVETGVSDDKSSEYSTCQSNDSEGSIGNLSENLVESESEEVIAQKEVSKPKSVLVKQSGVSTSKPKTVDPSYVSHIKSLRQQVKHTETPNVNRHNWIEKRCFVCNSTSHLF